MKLFAGPENEVDGCFRGGRQARLGQGTKRGVAPVLGPEEPAVRGGGCLERGAVARDALGDLAEIDVEEQPRQLVPEAAERLQVIAQEVEALGYGCQRDQIRP